MEISIKYTEQLLTAWQLAVKEEVGHDVLVIC